MSVAASGSAPRERRSSLQPGGGGELGHARPALGMARRDHRQQPGKIAAQPPMRADHRALFAGMGGGRRDHRAAGDRLLQGRELGRIGRRRRHVELEIAGGDDARRAERVQPHGVGRRAGEA